MTDIEFIKRFNNINITKICNKYNLYRNNVYTGKTTKENMKKVKEEIYKQLILLFLECEKDV